MDLLQVAHLKKYFATQKAVDDISLTIEQGQIFGLLGPNGAGKTTLIRMITGIFYPDSGTITLDGKAFDPVNDISKIGYMPEERGLYKKMKIGEQALYLARLKGLSKQEAIESLKTWFARFEMDSWWNKKVEDLSKGMQQKLQFVTTVLHRPRLIILDEPFSGLDPVNSNLIKDEIFNLAKNGATIIFSTHRMEQVEEICDHIVLVNKGQKILDGTVQGVKQEFKEHLYKITFAAPVAALEPNGLFSVKQASANTLIIQKNAEVSNNQILSFLLSNGLQIDSFNEILPTLNDIFIRKVEGTPLARRFQSIND
ncbi:ABC transporter ATP-binding protein [Niabella ginsenosidivorans]|uniref:ABC transporter ATP-binding protein n=1 Tax=Niabella ginsenosidivorans TaxID=1176587 RepID=A0A1A9I460_9BACT|nr:ABC transporter ATP-binding protein [Niabella ginsenosidivorans]ANH82458.1 ABC transporter ATP-binding protein [Niabella ginsenosidivorans]